MSKKQNKFRELERFLTTLLLFNLAFFVFFLFFSGVGVIFLKVVCALFAFLVSGFCLWLLHKTKEIFRPRALWLTCGFASMAILTLTSWICRFPGP